MTAFAPGTSGNPQGRKRGTPNKAAEAIRRAISDASGEMVAKVVQQAKDSDQTSQAMFLKLFPKHRFVSTPVTLTAATNSDEAKKQVAQLVALTAGGKLGLESLSVMSKALSLSIDARLSRLEELLEQREQEGSSED